MRRFVWGILLVAGVAGALLSQPLPVSAASDSGFNVITSPLPIKLSVQPGQSISTELRIKNQGDQPEDIKVGLMKFSASGSDGTPNIADLAPTDNYGSWVHFDPEQFTAQPNVWVTIKMTIDVPKSASLGYYLAITYSRASQAGVSGAANLHGAAATLVLLEVNTPNEKRQIQLIDFSTTHKLYEYLPATFQIKLRNSGNIYLAPSGNIFIQRGSQAVSTLDFNDAGGSILPGTNRLFDVTWNNGFPVFQDRLVNGAPVKGSNGLNELSLKWDFSQASKFRFGEYTAKLLVVYNNGTNDVPLESSLSFWVVPWKLMLIGMMLLALIGFGVWTVARTLVRGTRQKVEKLRNVKK